MANNVANTRKAYLNIIKSKYPAAFDQAFATIKRSGLGEVSETEVTQVANDGTWFDALMNNLTKILSAGAQYDLQKDLNKINLERVKSGQEPIDASTLGTTVGVGLSKDTRTLVYVMVGGAVLIALVALSRKR